MYLYSQNQGKYFPTAKQLSSAKLNSSESFNKAVPFHKTVKSNMKLLIRFSSRLIAHVLPQHGMTVQIAIIAC